MAVTVVPFGGFTCRTGDYLSGDAPLEQDSVLPALRILKVSQRPRLLTRFVFLFCLKISSATLWLLCLASTEHAWRSDWSHALVRTVRGRWNHVGADPG